jgi:hypothetical protein
MHLRLFKQILFLAGPVFLSACMVTTPEQDTKAVRESSFVGEKNGVAEYEFVVFAVYDTVPQIETAIARRARQFKSACPSGHEIVSTSLGTPYYVSVTSASFRANDVFIRFKCV